MPNTTTVPAGDRLRLMVPLTLHGLFRRCLPGEGFDAVGTSGVFASRDGACASVFARGVPCSPVSPMGAVQSTARFIGVHRGFLLPVTERSNNAWARRHRGEEKERMETQMHADDADSRGSKPPIRERLGFVARAG